MRGSLLPLVWLVGALAQLCAAPALAQGGPEEARRLRELVSVMVSADWWGGRAEPELLEGQLPAAVPEGFPEDLEVLATIVLGNAFTAYLGSPLDTEEATKRTRASLMVSGWKPKHERRELGFVMARPPVPTTFCRGSEAFMSLRAVPREGGGSALLLHYDADASSCDPEAVETPEVPMPRLPPPAGARVADPPSSSGGITWGGVSGDRRSYSTETILESDMSVAALTNHYGSLLEAGGWVAGSSAQGEEAALRTWTNEGAGGSWRAVLYALKEEPDRYQLVLRVDGIPEADGMDHGD